MFTSRIIPKRIETEKTRKNERKTTEKVKENDEKDEKKKESVPYQ